MFSNLLTIKTKVMNISLKRSETNYCQSVTACSIGQSVGLKNQTIPKPHWLGQREAELQFSSH